MASSVAGQRRAFGADVVPQCYEDLELADLVVLAGSNAAWCHPILYQRIQAARAERGMRVVNIDPRRTATGEGVGPAAVDPARHGRRLWYGLAGAGWPSIAATRHGVRRRAHAWLWGVRLRRARDHADASRQSPIATGLDGTRHRAILHWFAATRTRVVSCYSPGRQPVGAGHRQGQRHHQLPPCDGAHRPPGSGPLSLTGQPNAMGGREVGGLANMLAAHMGFSEAERDRVRRFWQAPNLVTGEGLKAVHMFEAVAAGDQGAVGDGHQPGVSLPRADAVRDALAA